MSEIFHDLNDVTVRGISVSEMSNNVYLVTSKADGAQLLIDAADDAKAIIRADPIRFIRRGSSDVSGGHCHDTPALGPHPCAAGDG